MEHETVGLPAGRKFPAVTERKGGACPSLFFAHKETCRGDLRSPARNAPISQTISGESVHTHRRAATRGPPRSSGETAGASDPPYGKIQLLANLPNYRRRIRPNCTDEQCSSVRSKVKSRALLRRIRRGRRITADRSNLTNTALQPESLPWIHPENASASNLPRSCPFRGRLPAVRPFRAARKRFAPSRGIPSRF